MNRSCLSITDASVQGSGASSGAEDREWHVHCRDLMLLVQSIRGAASSVLWALMITRIPMTNRELQDWTGYSERSITNATRRLVELGWINSYSRFGPWSVAAGRRLLAICASASTEPFADPTAISDASTVISASSSSSSGTYLESTNLEDKELLLEGESAESGPKFPPSRHDFSENLHALMEAGIREPAASMLASLPHVTPAYVREHVEQVLAEGQKLGAAIYRMRRGWLPPTKKRGRQAEVAERIRRFAEGE
jgi:hypothetical protein